MQQQQQLEQLEQLGQQRQQLEKLGQQQQQRQPEQQVTELQRVACRGAACDQSDQSQPFVAAEREEEMAMAQDDGQVGWGPERARRPLAEAHGQWLRLLDKLARRQQRHQGRGAEAARAQQAAARQAAAQLHGCPRCRSPRRQLRRLDAAHERAAARGQAPRASRALRVQAGAAAPGIVAQLLRGLQQEVRAQVQDGVGRRQQPQRRHGGRAAGGRRPLRRLAALAVVHLVPSAAAAPCSWCRWQRRCPLALMLRGRNVG